MSKGTPALIGWLGVVVLVLVLIGGVALAVTAPTKLAKQGIWEAFWQSLMRILDPGTVTGDGPVWVFRLLSLGVTFGGILIFSALIGVLTTGLDAKLAELRKGRSRVLESDHTVILGWSDQVFTIISELAEANSNQRKAAIAILAPKDKVEMEDEIRAKVPDTKTTKVVCRTGDPIDPDDIRLVNPDASRSIIVLQSEEDDPDAHLIKTLLAITNAPDRRPEPYHIVAAVSSTANLPAAKLAGGQETHLVDISDVTARLIVQTCLQSGLSVVHSSLLVYEGDEIYMQEQPQLVGWTFGDILHAYRTSSVLGLVSNGKVALNPPMHTRMQPGDQVVAISEDDDTVVLAPHPPMIDPNAIMAVHGQPSAPERTLILGWNERAATIMRELDAYVPRGSETLVVSDRDDAGVHVAEIAPLLRNTSANIKGADGVDRAVLDALNVGSFNHVIALSRDDLEPQVADSRNLVTLLHLRDMERQIGDRFSVVSEMADDRNRTLAQVTKADDFVVGDKLISLLMTQISENRRLADVFGDLFDPDGSEIYLKPAGYYVRLGMPVTCYTVVEAARRRGEVAIGYRLAAQAHQPPAYGVVINPDKAQQVVFTPEDRIIVLAED
ncbi:MAG: potassium transporter TrkA [Micromonosporaceae bacterium]|nr:potassium transporter TrkA [Micromonosporaceae bacterium]